MKKGIGIGRLVLIVPGVLVILLSARALMGVPAMKEALSSAVYLEEPVLLDENEGKLVVIHGKVEMTKPAHDAELALTLDTPKAYRYEEEYRQYSAEQYVYKYKWMSNGTKTIVGEAKIGEFVLDEKTLAAFPADDFYEDFDPAELDAYVVAYGKTTEGAMTDRLWVLENADYYYDEFQYDMGMTHYIRKSREAMANEREGARAFSYKAYDASRYDEMTAVGIQKDGMLTADENTGAMVYTGVVDMEQIVDTGAGYLMGGSVAFLAIGAVLLFLGLRPEKKKNERRHEG